MSKKILLSLLATAVIALSFSTAKAAMPTDAGNGVNTGTYHSYDGLICSDCHTLHNSEDGLDMVIDPLTGDVDTGAGPWGAMQKIECFTDTCLSCHQEGKNTPATSPLSPMASGWTAPIVMTVDGRLQDERSFSMPAGDFYHSDADPKKGHNPACNGDSGIGESGDGAVGNSDLMSVDPTLENDPPGAIAGMSGEWNCHSCHGMHSRFSSSYTAWRQVKRKVNGIVHSGCDQTSAIENTSCNKPTTTAGYEAILSNSRGDVNGVVLSDTILGDGVTPLDGADLESPESDSNHNVYKGGFSSFCATCHGGFHGGVEVSSTSASTSDFNGAANTADGTSKHWTRHPTNISLDDADGASKYTAAKYIKQVGNTAGTAPNPDGYDYKYPLIKVAGTWTSSDIGTVVNDDKLMCLSCHKAHAAPFANMLRWDVKTKVAFLASGDDDGWGDVTAEGRDGGDNPAYGCNKCHQKGGSNAYK